MHEDTKAQITALGAGLALAAAALAVSEVFGFNLFDHGTDAAVTAAIVQETAERGCAAQFGPGERWLRREPVFECVAASRELPSHVLTSPLSR